MTTDADLAALAEQLGPDWSFDGNVVLGPGGVTVERDAPHVAPVAGVVHLDLALVWRPEGHDEQRLRDCVAAPGRTVQSARRLAIASWAQTTLSTLQGLFGDPHAARHVGPGDPSGLAGRHLVVSPVITLGRGEDDSFARWWDDAPIGEFLAAAVGRLGLDRVHGVKLLAPMGDLDQTEVRIDGVEAPEASAAFRRAGWPLLREALFARAYVAVVPA